MTNRNKSVSGSRPDAKDKFNETWQSWHEGLAKQQITRATNLLKNCQRKQKEISQAISDLQRVIVDLDDAVTAKDRRLLMNTESKIGVIDEVRQSFSRPGVKARFAVEDRFYFGQPERFAGSLFKVELTDERGRSIVTSDEFANYAIRNVPGVSRSDFIGTMIDKVNAWATQNGKSVRAKQLIKGMDFSRPGSKDMMAKYRIGAQVAIDYKGETVRGTISSLVTTSPETYMVDIRGKNVRVKRLLSDIKHHFPTQNWLGQPMSRPGQPERFDASSLERGDFAEASKSPLLGKLLAAKAMPDGGWRAVQVGSDTLVISFEDADLARDFGRRVASKGYSATSPVATTGRYWNVEVKNGK